MERTAETNELLSELGISGVLADKYVLDKMVGEGGFAVVLGATHVRIKSLHFAVKVLRPEHATDTTNVKRFLREAETSASMRSPNVVRVADYGETGLGLPYMVMEFIDGPDIAVLIERYGRLRPFDVAKFSLDILGALEEAHGLGIVHRDLKPANVFVVNVPGQPHPVAKVGDFGIAKCISPDSPLAASATQTAAGNVLCTPAYAAPELLRGDVSTQGDIYALGHMMAEMLDGETPYSADHSLIVAAKHLEPDPAPLGEWTLGSGLVDIVRRAIDKDRTKRYADVHEMRADLQLAMMRVNPMIPRIALDGSDRNEIGNRPPSTGSLNVASVVGRSADTSPVIAGANTAAMTGDIDMVSAGSNKGLIIAAIGIVLLAAVGLALVLSDGGDPDDEVAVAESSEPEGQEAGATTVTPEPDTSAATEHVAEAAPPEVQEPEVVAEPEVIPEPEVVEAEVLEPEAVPEVAAEVVPEVAAEVLPEVAAEPEPAVDPAEETRRAERRAERRAQREAQDAERARARDQERDREAERETVTEQEHEEDENNPFAPTIIRGQ